MTTESGPTDGELLVAWRAGDRKSGELLFERHYKPITRFFQNKVREPGDLIQRTFLGCVEATDRFREDGNFRAYLLGIAVNVLRQHYRNISSPKEPDLLGTISAEDLRQSPSEVIAESDDQRMLLEGLRRLPTELQLILELHYWEKMKIREVAQILDLPEGTIKDRLRRGRKRLKEQLAILESSDTPLKETLTRLDQWAERLRMEMLRTRD